MSWFRVDDTLHAHRKLAKAGAEAMGLWVACGSFAASAASRQDGSLDADEVQGRALLLGIRDWKKTAARLVAAGLWDIDGDLYRFHDWCHYESAEGALEARRAKDAERARRAREKKLASRDEPNTSRDTSRDASASPSRDESDASRDALARVTGAPPRVSRDPVPSRPVPTQSAERASAPAALPTSPVAVEILAAAERLSLPVDADFANALALIAERAGKGGLVASALEDAAGALAAREGVTTTGQARDLIQRFVRHARPVAGVSGTGGGSGTYGAQKGRHGAPEPYNPFGPPTDEELRAAGVIQ